MFKNKATKEHTISHKNEIMNRPHNKVASQKQNKGEKCNKV